MIDEEKFLSFLEIFEIKDLSCLTTEFINQQFKILAKKYHPDTEGGDTNKFALLSQAKSFFLENMEYIQKILQSQNSPGLQNILAMKNFLSVLENDYQANENFSQLISRIEFCLDLYKLNLSVKFYFFALMILSKLNKQEIDFDSAINIICKKAIEHLDNVDYQKINFPRIVKNIDEFKVNITAFSDEDRLFYSIFYFVDLFMTLNFENKEDVKIKSHILFKQYLRDLEDFRCYATLMPSQHKMQYYNRKFLGGNYDF